MLLQYLPVLSSLIVLTSSFPLEDEEENLENHKEILWNSGKFEGDIVLNLTVRNGVTFVRKWNNKEIPYELSPVFSKTEADTIHEAVQEFAKKSCVKVRPKSKWDVDYIFVSAESPGCWSSVGCNGGRQVLNLQRPACVRHSVIVHEFLHAAGFMHQQSTWNRDKYVRINWNNIQKGYAYNFQKYGKWSVSNYGQPYDYGSIMHYTEDAFSVNRKQTITPKDSKWIGRIGKAEEMTDIDVAKLKAMYGC